MLVLWHIDRNNCGKFIHMHHAPYHVSGVAGLMTNILDNFKNLCSMAKL